MKILFKNILILSVILCSILILNFIASKQGNKNIIKILPDNITQNLPVTPLLKTGESIEISKVAPSKLISGEYLWVYFIDGQFKREVKYKNNPIIELLFSPGEDKFGYFVDYDIYDKSIPYDRTTVLYIEDVKTRKPKEVFHGTFRTGGWEWFSNSEILVYEGCGTECEVEFLIDLKTGKKYQLQYGVGYTWSPDKKWVFAYNYSYRTGITVGDKFGNIILRYHPISPESDMVDTPLAVWSLDSNKLALVMKSSNDKNLELSIFDRREKFKKIFQSKVEDEKEFKLEWTFDSKSVRVNDKSYHF